MKLLFQFTCLLFIVLTKTAYSQELDCKVIVNTAQLKTNQTAEQQTFNELEKAISNFMNNTRWSNDIFQNNEKIKCTLTINLLSSSKQNSFSGKTTLQVIRPVFGTNYETLIFQFVDNSFDFSFAPEDRQMLFNEQSASSNLTSMLAYYAMIALTADYDSFSNLGGTQFIQRAYNIINLANRFGGDWLQSSNQQRSRYWLVENLQNQQFQSFREGFYTYHRLILDDISTNSAEKRAKVLVFLRDMKRLHELRPNTVLLNAFLDAKTLEFVQLFSESTPTEKQEAYKILTSINPDKSETYRALVQ
jgi:Domain of unknown function (DUF4835)